MSKTKINFKLLRDVRDAVLAEPARVNMDLGVSTYAFASSDHRVPTVSTKRPMCDTVACIAGWGVTIKNHAAGRRNPYMSLVRSLVKQEELTTDNFCTGKEFIPWDVIEPLAVEAFGFPDEFDSDTLFKDDCWPEPFKTLLTTVKPGTYAYAGVVADRINHFIESYGGSIQGR